MEFHEVASIFPMMSESELCVLADDIKRNGLRVPVVIYGGKVLDGRNRYLACDRAGVEVRFEEYDGDDPVGRVVSLNLARRHLNESQRAVVAARLANMPRGNFSKSANLPLSPITQEEAGKLLNVSERSVRSAKELLEGDAERVVAVESGAETVHGALRKERAEKKKEEERIIALGVVGKLLKDFKSICDVRCCSVTTSGVFDGVDAVITDPPYEKKYIGVYEDLAKATVGVPLVAVMCGQSWLPDVLHLMCKHLTYRWMMAYLTFGNQYRQWDRAIDCAWKPVLLFGKPLDYVFDVVRSVADDKDHHKWGQSESGFAELVGKLTKPGQLVCDPFLGGGTTGVVSLGNGRRFRGCDVDAECVKRSLERLKSCYMNERGYT